jgi:hypothetical protein
MTDNFVSQVIKDSLQKDTFDDKTATDSPDLTAFAAKNFIKKTQNTYRTRKLCTLQRDPWRLVIKWILY